jgi:hypothetical protein
MFHCSLHHVRGESREPRLSSSRFTKNRGKAFAIAGCRLKTKGRITDQVIEIGSWCMQRTHLRQSCSARALAKYALRHEMDREPEGNSGMKSFFLRKPAFTSHRVDLWKNRVQIIR